MTHITVNDKRIYLYWCYELGVLPKGTICKPTSRIKVANQKE